MIFAIGASICRLLSAELALFRFTLDKLARVGLWGFGTGEFAACLEEGALVELALVAALQLGDGGVEVLAL